MNFEKLTIKAQEALSDAQKKAESLGHQAIENEHLLSALIAQKEGIIRPILEKLGTKPDTIANDLEKALQKMPRVEGTTQVYISPHLKQALDIAFTEADRLKDKYVSTEHMLIGISEIKDSPCVKDT